MLTVGVARSPMTLQSVLNTSEYVLALAWLPAWASNPTGDWCPSYANFGAPDDPGDTLMINHMNSDDGEWARTRLSLHGLWPTNEGVPIYFCNSSALDATACAIDETLPQCKPDPAGTRIFNTSDRWQRWARCVTPKYTKVQARLRSSGAGAS